jgi:hypothetical protein
MSNTVIGGLAHETRIAGQQRAQLHALGVGRPLRLADLPGQDAVVDEQLRAVEHAGRKFALAAGVGAHAVEMRPGWMAAAPNSGPPGVAVMTTWFSATARSRSCASLIHGFTNDGLVWASQLSALVHRRYQVIARSCRAWSLRAGRGHNDRP